MAEFPLRPHPGTLPSAKLAISVTAERLTTTLLRARYTVEGEVGRLRPSRIGTGTRKDGLWQTTCFEAFLRGNDARYCELNFASTSDWAAYEFADRRAGMRDAAVAVTVEIGPDHLYDAVTVTAWMDMSGVAFLDTSLWHAGFTAVLEEEDGSKSYWALAHPPGKPDFHHPACFAATLPAPRRP